MKPEEEMTLHRYKVGPTTIKEKTLLTDESLENKNLFHAAHKIIIKFNVFTTYYQAQQTKTRFQNRMYPFTEQADHVRGILSYKTALLSNHTQLSEMKLMVPGMHKDLLPS